MKSSVFTSAKGSRVVVRELRKTDVVQLLAFANSLIEEDTFVLLSGKKMTLAQESRYVSEALASTKKKEKIHIIAEVNGVIAGSAEIRRGRLRQLHVGEIGISVLQEFRREGIGRRLMAELIGQGTQMGLRILKLYCFENNIPAIRMYHAFGFTECGLFPDAFAYRSSFVSELTLYKKLYPI